VTAVAILQGRLTSEEGEKLKPYDDATGLSVVAPKGNLSWGRGFNLMQCGSPGLFAVMETYLLTQLDATLAGYAWYKNADDVRKSVFLDIAYNSGLHGLLGFPHMLAAAASGDWVTAAAECKVVEPELAGRYAALAQLLLTGVS
jgi:lysozyme